ncbi:MAG: bifunctional [glutamate--ammonia ligase]-adenylyl-L-tyrosine phosphorylase/[glutamate--ammonia-ligase] adenylyltransferase [bacterium]
MVYSAPALETLLIALEEGNLEKAEPVLREGGFDNPRRALLCFERLQSGMAPLLFSRLLPKLIMALSESSDPDMALNNWERFCAGHPDSYSLAHTLLEDTPLVGTLSRLFGFSQFLSDILIRNPDYLESLGTGVRAKDGKSCAQFLSELQDAAKADGTPSDRRDAACRYKRRELLRIGLRDFLAASAPLQIVEELSDLAEAVIRFAHEESDAALRQRFGQPLLREDPEQPPRPNAYCVMGMGKLGGRELNFSSDIDLIFVYEGEGETSGTQSAEGVNQGVISSHEFFCRLSEAVIHFIADAGPEGNLYRVDTRLRPEGEAGPLARSLEACEYYYHTQARTWEKLALIKARAVAGDQSVASNFQKIIESFVYETALREGVLEEIQELKRRIDLEVMKKDRARREVKRGTGGIREIEFVVQTLQLLHGPQDVALRARPTCAVLQRLRDRELITPPQYQILHRAYWFFRTVEHRLQMMFERQTHTIPEDDPSLRQLAVRCGIRPGASDPPETLFRRRYENMTGAVHRIFETFFQTGRTPEGQLAEDFFLILDPNAKIEERFNVLRHYRFHELGSVRQLERMARGSTDYYVSAEAQQFFEQILPKLLEICRGVPFPDQAIRMFDSFLRSAQGISIYYDLMIQQPKILELLVRIFGTSLSLARDFISHPEFLDTVIDPSVMRRADTLEEKKEQVRNATRGYEDDPPGFATALRRWKRLSFLGIAACDLTDLAPLDETARQIAKSAEAALDGAIRFSERQLVARYGWPMSGHNVPPPAQPAARPAGAVPFAIVALGKLGSREMNYQSDLDLVFVYEDEGTTTGPDRIANSEFFARLAEGVISLLSETTGEGFVFKVDARLRPEGRNAPLTASLRRYIEYFNQEAQTWEFQSLLKARPVAGDLTLGHKLLDALSEILRRWVVGKPIAEEVRAMRERLEQTVKLPSWASHDFKKGSGGLLDIEFLLQYLQLTHVPKHPELFNADPHEVISILENAGLLSQGQVARLRTNFNFLRRLENRVRLLFDIPHNYFPATEERLEALMVELSPFLPEKRRLMEYFKEVLAWNREIFNRLIALPKT